MADPRVVIVGCGIAGPVMALLLKQKGYQPCVVEKVRRLGDVGGSLYMQPNGLKVLSLVGLADKVLKGALPVQELQDMRFTGELLGKSNVPSTFKDKYGYPAAGVLRTDLNLALKDELLSKGIPLHEGWRLRDIQETDTGVVAISADGGRVEGSFLIGCDGLKAVSRELLLSKKGISKEKPAFTGLVQRGGRTPKPASFNYTPGLVNFYGPGAHVVAYPVGGEFISWAITSPDSEEAEESWAAYSAQQLPEQKEALLQEFEAWCTPVKDLIHGVQRLMKYGLYDRPELAPNQWYGGRIVLTGDCASPTSPHLGQGANQALESCYHLARLLPAIDSASSTPISTRDLSAIFRAFAKKRQPRTAALVKGARVQGERRVVDAGPTACDERDEILRQQWKDEAGIAAKYEELLSEPFM